VGALKKEGITRAMLLDTKEEWRNRFDFDFPALCRNLGFRLRLVPLDTPDTPRVVALAGACDALEKGLRSGRMPPVALVAAQGSGRLGLLLACFSAYAGVELADDAGFSTHANPLHARYQAAFSDWETLVAHIGLENAWVEVMFRKGPGFSGMLQVEVRQALADAACYPLLHARVCVDIARNKPTLPPAIQLMLFEAAAIGARKRGDREFLVWVIERAREWVNSWDGDGDGEGVNRLAKEFLGEEEP
jgi:hypothetical protein